MKKDKSIEKNNRLTPKQEKFCIEYAKTANATEAYRRAGYLAQNPNTQSVAASTMLRNPKIKKRLAELADVYLNSQIADIQEIQRRLTDILRQVGEEEVLIVEGCGEGISQATRYKKKASHRDALKAAELLIRMQGGFNDNVNVTGAVPVFISEDIPENDDEN